MEVDVAQARRPQRPDLRVPALAGRARELATVAEALSTPPAMVLITGEAGIGKSRLVREVVAAPAVAGRRPAVGTCPPYLEPSTLAPVVDVLSQVPEVADLPLSDLAGALRPLFPEWASQLPPAPEAIADPMAARHRLFRALAELIGALGIGVLVLEDVHWADESTLEFLLFLAARQPSVWSPSLVLTYRPEDVQETSRLARLTSRLPAGIASARVELSPLNVADTGELISSMLADGPLPEGFAAALHQRTEGLPLAVEESVRLLVDRTDLTYHDGRWVPGGIDELQVPPTVRDLTMERVRGLTPTARRMLRAAAVMAGGSAESVSAVAGVAPRAGRTGASEAVARGLLREDARGRLEFRHVLTTVAVYEAIPGSEARRLHLRAGRVLEAARPLPAVQLSRHFRAAGAIAKWRRYAELAADRAAAAGDYTTAATLLDDLLGGADLPVHEQVRLAGLLGRLTLRRGDPVDRLHRQVTETLGRILSQRELRGPDRADIRAALGRLHLQRGAFEAGTAELAQAVPDLSHDPATAARAMVYLGWPLAGSCPAAVHLDWLSRAAALDIAELPALDRLTVTADRAIALLLLGEEAGWQVAGELPGPGAAPEQDRELARALVNMVEAALLWGRFGEVAGWMATAEALADEHQLSRLRLALQETQANLDWFTGAWGTLPERVTSLRESGHLPVRLGALRLAGRLAVAAGRHDEAQAHFQHAMDEALRAGVLYYVPESAAALAQLRLDRGDPAAAVRATAAAADLIAAKGVWLWAGELAPVRVAALSAAGEHEHAQQLIGRFSRGLRGRHAPAPQAALAQCRAVRSEHQDEPLRAAAAYARAARAWDGVPRPYDALLARESQARLLRRAGRQQEALALLSTVLDGFEGLGAGGDADRVRQAARAAGGEVPRPWRGGRYGYGDRLSPRELEVVRLVVAGQTNREIARTLWKAPSTVTEQLRTAMRKLEVSSRTALAVKAVESGIFFADVGGEED